MTLFTASAPSTGTRAATGTARGLWSLIAQYAGVLRQRQALAKLDDAALQDIGISRQEAEEEINRPFWDLPDFWKG